MRGHDLELKLPLKYLFSCLPRGGLNHHILWILSIHHVIHISAQLCLQVCLGLCAGALSSLCSPPPAQSVSSGPWSPRRNIHWLAQGHLMVQPHHWWSKLRDSVLSPLALQENVFTPQKHTNPDHSPALVSPALVWLEGREMCLQ